MLRVSINIALVQLLKQLLPRVCLLWLKTIHHSIYTLFQEIFLNVLWKHVCQASSATVRSLCTAQGVGRSFSEGGTQQSKVSPAYYHLNTLCIRRNWATILSSPSIDHIWCTVKIKPYTQGLPPASCGFSTCWMSFFDLHSSSCLSSMLSYLLDV